MGIEGADAALLEALIGSRVKQERAQTRVFADTVLEPIVRVGKGRFEGGVFCSDKFVPELGWFRGPYDQQVLIAPPPLRARSVNLDQVPEAWFGGVLIWHFGSCGKPCQNCVSVA